MSKVNRKVCVAPMMDCTDRHDRYFLRLISKNVMLYSEMISTGAILKGKQKNVLEFNDIRIEELMTPRVHMDVMPEDFDLYEATDYVVNHTHSRIPVYRETTDHIVGVLSVKELLRYVNEEEKPDEVTLRNLELQRPIKVPASMKAQQLFTMFKNEKSHIAIVLDEHGGTGGLITMEDLLEELVGDIMDEEDEEEDEEEEEEEEVEAETEAEEQDEDEAEADNEDEDEATSASRILRSSSLEEEGTK